MNELLPIIDGVTTFIIKLFAGVIMAIIAYFAKQTLEEIQKINVKVAQIYVKLDGQDEKIADLKTEQQKIRDRLHEHANQIHMMRK